MKTPAIIGGAVALVGGLLVIVFATIQFVDSPTQASGPEQDADGTKPIRVMEIAVDRVIDKGDGPVSQAATVRILTMPSPDVPDASPDVSGVLLDRGAEGLLVGTGSIEAELDVRIENGEAPVSTLTLSHDGPEVQVLVTPDTTVYRDETALPGNDLDGVLPKDADVSLDGEIVIDQVVTLVDSLDEAGENTEVQAWGTETGEGLVADVVVYRIVSHE
jgi:hypothetical protein